MSEHEREHDRERARILAVDDDPGMRRALSRTLLPSYVVELATSAAEARELLKKRRFDVALVDIQLGDGDGYTLCREIRSGSPETDVILITGSRSEPDEKLYRSLEEGAFYFLFKPFERRVLQALVERCLDLRRARRSVERYARNLREDLERARRFQMSLIPREPLHHEGWHVEGRFRPCDALGGDFFLAVAAGAADHSLVFALSDVAGHGVRAAMYAGMLRSLLDTARRRNPSPDAVRTEILHGIDFFESESYASLVYGQLGPKGTLRYFNAGHPPPLLLRASGEAARLQTTDRILTPLLGHSSSPPGELQLAPGERLLAFSDGLSEALDPSDREWGVDGLTSALREMRGTGPGETLDYIMRRLEQHGAGRPLADDATLLLVERTTS